MQSFPGSRWWKFDFHNHTPASSDYDPSEKSIVTPEQWLLAYMRAGIDAVVVTDHNSADWIDELQTCLIEMSKPENRADGWRAHGFRRAADSSAGAHGIGNFCAR